MVDRPPATPAQQALGQVADQVGARRVQRGTSADRGHQFPALTGRADVERPGPFRMRRASPVSHTDAMIIRTPPRTVIVPPATSRR